MIMMNLLIMLMKYMFMIIPVLMTVALFTWFESKIMGYMQSRQGPMKVGFLGILQAFADGLKLMMKEPIMPINSNYLMYITAPILTLSLSLMNWIFMPFSENMVLSNLDMGILFMLGISSLGVYGIIMAGWSSNSKYAFLGALSSAAQMISYEVSIGLMLMTLLVSVGSLNLSKIIMAQFNLWFMMPFFPLFILFFMSSMAETNSHPFDLPEAEAELVSGYNVEYSSVGFALFFMGEYVNMMLMSTINVMLFFGGWLPLFNLHFFSPIIWFTIKVIINMYMYMLMRAMLPRYSYDQLMVLGWKVFLPLSISLLIFYVSLMLSFDYLP